MEHASTQETRPRLSREQIAAFMPERGEGRFPAPYGTRFIRLTNASDGDILPLGMSYWSNVNNHAGQPHLLAFIGTTAGQPILLHVDKATGTVTNQGPIGPGGTGEGWYFSATRPTSLYFHQGPQMIRHDVATQQAEVVFDISTDFPGCRVWQMHSSDDDQVHCATVERVVSDGPYVKIGCVVADARRGQQRFFPTLGDFDECQVDTTGTWLVIKETLGRLINRVINLDTGSEIQVDLALGHSDVGAGSMTGEDAHGNRWEVVTIDLATMTRRLDFHGIGEWGSGMGHVSVRGNQVLLSNKDRDLGVVPLDGSCTIQIIAPNLVDQNAGDGDYDRMPKANLDPPGEFAALTANGHGRRDFFLVGLR
jgi:hypothetical protein